MTAGLTDGDVAEVESPQLSERFRDSLRKISKKGRSRYCRDRGRSAVSHVGTGTHPAQILSATILQAASDEDCGGRWHIMPSSERKLSLIAVLVAVLLLFMAPGCTGFFVSQPNSIAVTTTSGATTFTVAQNSSVQLKATATYNSGSKDVTKSATWQSSTPCATVTAGLVNGVGATSNVTITAVVAGISGSATGTVTGGTAQTLTVTPTNQTFTLASTPTTQFFAAENGADVTNSATWTSGNTSVVTFSSTTPGLATFVAPGTTTVTASIASGSTCASGSTNVTIQ